MVVVLVVVVVVVVVDVVELVHRDVDAVAPMNITIAYKHSVSPKNLSISLFFVVILPRISLQMNIWARENVDTIA